MKPASFGGLSRPPLERMLRIHQAIASGRYPSASHLALELEVSPKSIYRDLEFMRDRLDLPLEYEPARFGYHYTQPVSGFPAVQITEGELWALAIAEKALRQYRGTSFERPLISAFRKIAASLPDTVTIHLGDGEPGISFHTTAEPILDLAMFDRLARATTRREQLRLRYRKPGQPAPEERVVDPYHLANINGEWFLFGWCHLRRDLRTFAPSRIVSAEPTGRRFERPSGFSIERQLRDSFGVIAGRREHRVAIRFHGLAAELVREKRWHPSQRLVELRDGGIELRMRLSSLVEVRRWVLGWGGSAVARQPRELVQGVRTAAERIIRGHAGRSSRPAKR
ncbi:MAG TPA: WYL domain-containing protein [Candidatus Paceibacterota bacterium]|nr:WYL domain-containing protein [Verrucomicrobiota bacterium]HOX03351.1 WYL domain-containing protein [Verrucomicrobiota bacterium]HRZ46271.1 WYL domain-containing protein [Candidatus Paceibacterota bacterium]HRZ91982.1 WYL domain-containing protein [Candidatus Paceibacterota bacterium]